MQVINVHGALPVIVIDADTVLTDARRLYDSDNCHIRLVGELSDSFLADFSKLFCDLDALTIHMYGLGGSYDFLYGMHRLSKLYFTFLNRDIDFALLPELVELGFSWNDKVSIRNLMRLEKLRHLYVSDINDESLAIVTSLPGLHALRLDGGLCKNLNEIGQLPNLKALSIGGFKKLVDITGISTIPLLSFLEFNLCSQLQDFSPLGHLKQLEILEIIDCRKLSSVSFVRNMENLKQLSILGTTIVADADLSHARHVERVYTDLSKYKLTSAVSGKDIPGERVTFKRYLSGK